MTQQQIALLESIRQCAPEKANEIWLLIDDLNRARRMISELSRKLSEADKYEVQRVYPNGSVEARA